MKAFSRPFLGNVLLRRRLAQGFGPSMSFSPVQQLAQNGAILKVQIANPSGGTPVDLMAMIDTGASITTMIDSVAQRAGLQQTGQTQLGGVGGVQMSAIYAAAVSMPDYGVNLSPVQVATIPGGLPGVDMLIGRDILMGMTMTYEGGQGSFSLVQDTSAPPPGTVANPATPGTVAQPGQPAQYLPQPPGSGFPWLWVGGGAAAVALGIGGLFLFKVL